MKSRCVPQPLQNRRGNAPPVDPFTGEDLEMRLKDWLLSLEIARDRNDRTEDELVLQLAGHLHGRTLQKRVKSTESW